MIADRGEGHQTPPDTVIERPVHGPGPLPLEGEDEAGEHEDRHQEHQEDEPQLLVSTPSEASLVVGYLVRLVDGVHQGLETHKMSDHFQDSQNSHQSQHSD